MRTKFRVSWTFLGVRYASEYATAEEAECNRRDIAGYEGIENCRLDPVTSDEPPDHGPFELERTRFDRREVV